MGLLRELRIFFCHCVGSWRKRLTGCEQLHNIFVWGASCLAFLCGVHLRKKRAVWLIRFLWGAKFDSQFVNGLQDTDLSGHPSSERAIRCASRNFDRKSLSSQPSVFAIANLCFICTIMSRQLRPSWIRTHPTIDRSVRFCTTPSFCKQPFVNGKVASAKSIAGDTTASNNFSRKTKETCFFNKVCLFNKVFNKVCLECDAAAISHSICLTLFEIGTDGGVY